MSRDPASNVMNREEVQARHNTLSLAETHLAIRGHLCFRCLLPGETLAKCGGCKRVWYCGKYCQSRDWELQHKNECKILKAINKAERAETALSRTREEWTTSQSWKINLVHSLTKDPRPLDIVHRQPYCIQCHRSSIQLPSGTVLIPCSICHLVASCSSCASTPSSHTPEDCKKYRQLGLLEKFFIEQFNTTGRVYSHALTEKPRYHYRALKTAANWYEYFTEISDKSEEIGNFLTPDTFELDEGCVSLVDAERQAAIRHSWLFLLNSTEIQSMPLTILAALEDTTRLLPNKKSLTLHIVGASMKEVHASMVFEELFHLLPALSILRLVMIGPKFLQGNSADNKLGEATVLGCCRSCKAHGRKQTLRLFSGMYHDFGALSSFKKPDLAVLFHSGRSQSQVELWKPTTKFLVDMSIPTVCTTYTAQEAVEEVEELNSLDARMLKEPEINRWKGLMHLPEVMEGDEGSFYYCNYYRYIFQGRK